ncbi:MAG: PqqD family protein [Acidobacteriota bacterium]
MSLSPRYAINAPHVVHEIFDDQEAAIINLKSGNYYSLNPSGAKIWSLLECGATDGEIVAEMIGRYEGSEGIIANSIHEFVLALLAEDLIVQADSVTWAPPGERLPSGCTAPFTAPSIERYNDMQELLLLDPIHEVDETGWPNRRSEAAD